MRVALGAVGLLSAVRIVAYGWIDPLYAGPSHRFTYLGFGWVPQPSAPLMTGVVGGPGGVVGGAAAGLADPGGGAGCW